MLEIRRPIHMSSMCRCRECNGPIVGKKCGDCGLLYEGYEGVNVKKG